MSSLTGNTAFPEFVVLIPARRASSRLTDKVLADIGGKPMVVRVAERAAQSGASRVVVATDDREIEAVVQKHGFSTVMTRSGHPSGTDRLAEAVSLLDLADTAMVVNVQGDEPLIAPMLVSAVAAELAKRADCAMATACHAVTERADMFNPNIVKVVLDQRNTALYFSRATIPWARDAFSGSSRHASTGAPDLAIPPGLPIYRHIGIYAYRVTFLKRFPALQPAPIEQFEALEQLRALWHGYRIAVLQTDSTPAPGVDTQEDLALVRKLFSTQ